VFDRDDAEGPLERRGVGGDRDQRRVDAADDGDREAAVGRACALGWLSSALLAGRRCRGAVVRPPEGESEASGARRRVKGVARQGRPAGRRAAVLLDAASTSDTLSRPSGGFPPGGAAGGTTSCRDRCSPMWGQVPARAAKASISASASSAPGELAAGCGLILPCAAASTRRSRRRAARGSGATVAQGPPARPSSRSAVPAQRTDCPTSTEPRERAPARSWPVSRWLRGAPPAMGVCRTSGPSISCRVRASAAVPPRQALRASSRLGGDPCGAGVGGELVWPCVSTNARQAR